jgi:hypothetical protein
MRWWWQLRKSESDLEREVRSDLELEEEEQQEKGLPPDEAGPAARRAFGNEALIKEQTRDFQQRRGLKRSAVPRACG